MLRPAVSSLERRILGRHSLPSSIVPRSQAGVSSLLTTSALQRSFASANRLRLSSRSLSNAALNPKPTQTAFDMAPSETHITTLPNGLRIASQDAPGHFVACGVYVDAGTRFENDELAGCSHILDRTTFKSTKQFTTEQIVQELESMGGNCIAHSSREAIMYQGLVFRHDLAKMMKMLGQVVRHPLLLPEEMDDTRQTTMYEIQELQQRPEMILPEHLHAVAFRNAKGEPDTLGRPLLCSMERLEVMSTEAMRKYRDIWYTPDRMVVAGIGMDHQMLVDLASKEFGDMPSISPATAKLQSELRAPARYEGGITIFDTKDLPPSPNPDDKQLTHVYIAFESLPISDPDVYALATLTSLMGGGGSFSAGGPGKGMYTRLYTQVLNRYHWVENCNMLNFSYLDTGLFGIQASIPPSPEAHAQIIPVLCDQLLRMTTEIGAEELSRAKNQLKSNLLMSLEAKVVECEDIGRQIMVQGHRLSVAEMCKRIESLTAEDLKRVARRIVLGQDVQSPLDFGDPAQKHWERSGDGRATVVVEGPLFENDAFLNMEQHLKTWRMGKPNNQDVRQPLGGRKWGLGKFKL